MSVTVAMLIYRSPTWLAFALEGLAWARNRTPHRVMVVGNDAEPEVVATGRLDLDFRNPPKYGELCPDCKGPLKRCGKHGPAGEPPIGLVKEHYLSRVYRAWNAAVEAADTEYVVLMNSDMYVSDWWLDELMEVKCGRSSPLSCSLLVESGRIPSAMPEHVRNFGLTPDEFDWQAWRDHAARIRQRGATEPGRLYMPVLFERETFLRSGGYPLGNPPGTTGDKYLFGRLQSAGLEHLTALGSVVYHVQTGEMLDGE